MRYLDWTSWTPGRPDTGQVDECTRERAVLKIYTARLSEEERCHRAFRAVELERVATETRRAASTVIHDAIEGSAAEAPAALYRLVANTRLAVTIAALNLMGIETLLPGEPPFHAPRELIDATRIYLREPPGDGHGSGGSDGLDALSGLIGDFHRSTVFINGLRIEPRRLPAVVPLTLRAAHPAIMVAFGEFLAHKYVIEGWSLL
ncbi:hypothetical protein GCM10023321_51880 [Pseudonocardia eucalypti]|uniref:Uncharacterized protein n=1 Tax=Pseudonocardia eucalypti TaxID=648755 RepID=A0ABP9QM78_9PSEU|nr:hypothetical protein [Pseudonocardia eucalypti]